MVARAHMDMVLGVILVVLTDHMALVMDIVHMVSFKISLCAPFMKFQARLLIIGMAPCTVIQD